MIFLKKDFKFISPSIIIIGIAILMYISCSSPPDDSQLNLLEQYYSKAEIFFENEEIDSSLYYIDRCFDIDRDYSKAHYLRGKIYLYKDGIYNRRVSATALKKAVLKDIDNAEYHYSLGLTLEKQGFFKNALDEFKEATRYDSTDTRSYKQAAALYQMHRYPISARILRDAVALCDDTSAIVDCELLLGTDLVRMGDFDSAYAAFESARAKMSNIARAEMDNPRFLMTPGDYESLTEESLFMQKRILRQFWGELDPDPTTEINERRLEHYSRFVHSRLTFSIPEKSVDGCKTKRGEMYIRYGPPSSKDYLLGGSGTGRDVPKWVWTYNHFPEPITLVFEDTFLDGDFDFPFPSPNWTASDYANNPSVLAENMRSSYPQVFSMNKGSGPLNFAYFPRKPTWKYSSPFQLPKWSSIEEARTHIPISSGARYLDTPAGVPPIPP
jgi:GWxTD domain-containing protein